MAILARERTKYDLGNQEYRGHFGIEGRNMASPYRGSFIHSFIHSSIHPSIHPSIHSFIHSFIHSLQSARTVIQTCCLTSSWQRLTLRILTHTDQTHRSLCSLYRRDSTGSSIGQVYPSYTLRYFPLSCKFFDCLY